MNFDFSDEQKQLRDSARRFLEKQSSVAVVRRVLEGDEGYDRELWQGLAEMGFTGAAIPEEFGGAGLGYLELCVIAEELGRAVAPVPFSSTVYLAAEFLLAAGNDAQKKNYLPKIAAGEVIGTFAYAETAGEVTAERIKATVSGGKLSGTKIPVADGAIADFAVVAAQGGSGLGLYLVDLTGPGVTRTVVDTIDPSRKHARIVFDGAPVEQLGAGNAEAVIEAVYDRAAVLTAFEQVGGSDRALEMARDYALERIAFGRQIGSFQAIKHILADMYVSATLARSNCYWGAYALSTGSAELPEAAASCRVSATRAFQHCSTNNIQVHGGMGFTWQFDCHLYYKRSNLLALNLGSLSVWENRLIARMRARNSARDAA
ncbi:acyl-CoA dehydrogenase family protein [Camelimonas lactis]|uniref:Acyl-CoA dehydrogenase n=1 Tax=Camelimonas lactis TaxID=659006 RepID=A0A4R2GTA5_9HYPH|nr:acyl-CoA dehydrogenase family protein [Camelimonas lactis]TCO13426.1 acyl-CoA dehydrogenase [Camelimonas lactis]